MKTIKFIRVLSVLLLVVASIFLTVSCDGTQDGSGDPTYSTYSVTVLGSNGEAMSGAIVTVYKGDTRVGANITSKDGKVEFPDLEDTSYTVTVETTSQKDKYYYDASAAVLNPSSKDITVTLYNSLANKNREIYGLVPDGTLAYSAVCGNYHISLDSGTTYVVVELTKMGIYGISVSGGSGVTVANLGNPYYVMSGDISEDNETGSSFTMKAEGDLVQLVVGISSSAAADAFLSIQYVSDLPSDPMYSEWTMIQAENAPAKSVLPDNAKLVNVNITDRNVVAVLGTDGYYHLGTESGPVIYMRVTESSDYLDSFVKICENTNFGWYKYDGEIFVVKECFNELILAYGNVCDDRLGVCPLTEELAYAIKSFGEYRDWWNFNTENHIFYLDYASIFVDNAWLFAAATVALDTEAGTSEQNKLTLRTEGAFTLCENTTLYYTSAEISDLTVTISDADGLVVNAGGTEYTANDGVISFTLTGTGKTFSVSCATGSEISTFTYTAVVSE